MIIYVDADACPVKEEVVRVATRYGLEVYMVSNQGVRRGGEPNVHAIIVGKEFDAADNWIAERAGTSDIVITADIQLAARCVKNGAGVLGPSGKPFTEDNIGSALAMRELSSFLRDTGEISGHNASFSQRHRSDFLQALDRMIQKRK